MAIKKLTTSSIRNNIWYRSILAGNEAFRLRAGYFAGGLGPSGVRQSSVDKLDFPSDTRTTLAEGLSAATSQAAGFADTGVAGYVAGGASPSSTAKVEKYAFPADTRTLLATGISTADQAIMAMANKAVAGYVGGGFARTTVDKFAFPSDTRTTLGTGLSVARSNAAGFANYGTAGYAAGGRNDNTSSNLDSVDKFAFPSDTRTTLGTGLSTARSADPGSFGSTNQAGYVGGGRNTSDVVQSSVDKFAFPSDTRTTLATGLASPNIQLTGCSNDGVAGYFAGGENPSATNLIEKYTFPTDTKSTVSGGLSIVRAFFAGFANS